MFDQVTWRSRLKEMRLILENDRIFLLKGQIDKLTLQDRRRQAIEEKLHEIPERIALAEMASIETLKRLAARNHRLLKAYIDGARRAAQQLGAMEKNLGRIGAYRRDGTRVPSSSEVSTKQQRA